MQYHVEVGLLILALAFIVSFFLGLGVHIDLNEYWRFIAILEANPNYYLGSMRDAFLYLILPPAVGLAFSIIALIRERKSPTGIFDKWWLPLAVIGGFFSFWGVYGLWWEYNRYLDAIRWVNFCGSVDIMEPLLAVYATAWVGNVLWLFAGVLFTLSPVFKMMLREK